MGILFIYFPRIYLLSQTDTFLLHPPRRDHFLGGGEETRPPLPPGRPGQLYGARDFSFSTGGRGAGKALEGALAHSALSSGKPVAELGKPEP